MNKLFIVKFTIHGQVISVKSFWSNIAALNYMEGCGNDTWRFKLEENNDIHKIWIAR